MLIGGWWASVSMFIGAICFPIIGAWTFIPLATWGGLLITWECWLDAARVALLTGRYRKNLGVLERAFVSTIKFRVRETEHSADIDMKGMFTRWLRFDGGFAVDKVDGIIQKLYDDLDVSIGNPKAPVTIRVVTRAVEPANPVIIEEEK